MLVGIILGALLGEGIALFLIEYLHWTRFMDCLFLNLLLVMLYGIGGILLGLLLGLLINRMKGEILIRPQHEIPLLIAMWIFVVVILYAWFCSPFSLINAPYSRYSFVETARGMLLWTIGRAALMALGALVLSWILYRIALTIKPQRPVRRRRKISRGWWFVVAVWPSLLVVFWVHNLTKLPKTLEASRPRVIGEVHPVTLITWGGADWNDLEPLIQEGRMPNLQKLISQGYQASLEASCPHVRNMAWASLLTGHEPARHGVLGAHAYKLPLVKREYIHPPHRTGFGAFLWVLSRMRLVDRRPTNALDRRMPMLWELTSEAGLRCNIIGGAVTFPASPVEGFLVTNAAIDRLFASSTPGAPVLMSSPGLLTYPDALYRMLSEDFQKVQSEVDMIAERLAPGYLTRSALSTDSGKAGELDSVLKRAVERDHFIQVTGARLQQHYASHLSFFDLEGLSSVQRAFWRYQHPQQALGVSRTEVEKYQSVIHRYYEWLDESLADIVESASPPANILLISDYGHSPVFLDTLGDSGIQPCPGKGFIVMAGPRIRKQSDASRRNIQPQHLVPTILSLLGLQVTQDLPGRVLDEAIEPLSRIPRPTFVIPGYQPITDFSLPESSQLPLEAPESEVD